MQDILRALARAVRSLVEPDIFWHLLWPTLLALVLWGGLMFWFWDAIAQAFMLQVQSWPLVGAWFGGGHDLANGVLTLALHMAMLLLLLPLVYVTAALLVSAFAISFMLDRVAARSYGELELRRGGSQVGSLVNALATLFGVCVLALLSLPLWFVPGLGIILALWLSAWLNKRCYAYDALMNHADAEESARLRRMHGGSLWLLGIGTGLLAFVPLLNLFVPALTGLAFVHYLLEALRRERNRPLHDVTPVTPEVC